MFAANAGSAISSPGVEALFYSRFGVEFLPLMFVILGLVSPATSLAMTAVLVRVSQVRLFLLMPLLMAGLLVGARLLLMLQQSWFYPVLWLGMNVFWILQSLFVWGLAGAVCDTRQAKRLFPLFGVGGILGVMLGSLATSPLVDLVGTENLLLAWIAGLLMAFVLARSLLAGNRASTGEPPTRGAQVSVLDQLRQSVRYVRGSALLSWVSLSAVLFAVMWFSLGFGFARAVTLEFPDEAAVASFLGTFQGAATGAAVLASLFLANRLYARFGFMTIMLVYPIIYLVGFSLSVFSAGFALLVAFRFAQVFWASGLFEGAVQAMFNVVPPDRRQNARTFIIGIANQLGISLTGVMLIVSDRFLPEQALFVIGALAAAGTTYFIWRARRAYGSAVVAALRAGQSSLFFSDEEPFGGFRRDATAVSAAVSGLANSDVTVRRAAAEILGSLNVPEAVPAMVAALDDEDASVRISLLRALGSADATDALLEVAAALHDPDPAVRQQAIDTLAQLTPYSRGLVRRLQPMLADPEPAVRCWAAAAMLRQGDHQEAADLLKATAAGEGGASIAGRIYALEALAEWGSPEAYEIAALGLRDPEAAVRRASAQIIGRIDAQQCVFELQMTLRDQDSLVREAAAKALGEIGRPALEGTVEALANPRSEAGALEALRYLPTLEAAPAIEDYALGQVASGVRYHELWRKQRSYLLWRRQQTGAEGESDQIRALGRAELLADALQDRARAHGSNALKAMATLGDAEPLLLAVSQLSSSLGGQRANAMETLDALGRANIVRPLLPIWETVEPDPADGTSWLGEVLSDEDDWVRAAGALAVGLLVDARFNKDLARLAESDASELVRESARLSLDGERKMETLQTLSVMERVLSLRRVPLLADLPPDDLVHIASVSQEAFFSDGTVMANQGEVGDELYIILSGTVLVTAQGGDGEWRNLARRTAGEYVGEMAILSDEVRMATLTAAGDVRALTISQAAFNEILRLRPEASLKVISVLCDRLRQQVGVLLQ